MRIRRLCLIVVVMLIPSTAGANDHVASFFAGYSLAGGSKLSGVQQAFDKVINKPWDKKCSIVGDLSLNIGEHNGADLTRVTYLSGVRFALIKHKSPRNPPPDPHKHVPFVNGLVGGLHDSVGDDKNHLSGALGGGWEFLPKGGPGGVATRIQVDRVFVRGNTDFWRLSAGMVYRIPPKTPTPVP